jgi:sugar phosphate isomerase/epimerase
MSDLGPDDLVFNTTNLLGGGVREIVAAAVAGDYRGITIWPSDVARAEAEGLSLADVKAFIHDHGLVVTDVDCLLGWTEQALPKPGEAMVEIVPTDRFLDIAEALDADAINVAQGFGSELDLDRAAEDLAKVARRAAEQGRNVNFEFLPWCGVPDVTTCLDLLERTGCPNTTIMFDSWHWFRGARDLDALKRIPGARIGSTQWNDAPEAPADDLMVEAMEARLLPGEGDIPLVDLVRTLDAIGSTAPVGVEVIQKDHESMAPEEVGRRTADAMRAILREARGENA